MAKETLPHIIKNHTDNQRNNEEKLFQALLAIGKDCYRRKHQKIRIDAAEDIIMIKITKLMIRPEVFDTTSDNAFNDTGAECQNTDN